MDNTVKLISMIAGIIGGVAQAFMSSRELYNYAKYAKENHSKTETTTSSTETKTEEV